MPRILLVEDHDDLRAMMHERLLKEEYQVNVFDNGLDAHYCLQTTTFDLLILDWELPGMAGIEILKRFREAGGTTPVLMLTGRKLMEDKEAGFEAGADDYLTKPFNPKEFSARIKALLRRQLQPRGIQHFENGAIIADKYQIISLIGEGGVGMVYKAHHKFLDKLVALKLLRGEYASDQVVVSRFRREAQAVDSLKHPNIAAVHDYGILGDGRPFMIMDFIEGRTLYNLLVLNKRLDVRRAVSIFIKVCDALSYAHKHGVIHRDLKPSNIMLVEDNGIEVPKLLDFGIAKLLDTAHSQQLTRTGEFCGSPLYVSPEQCTSSKQDQRSDIFSLGCVMCETLTGEAPFHGETVMETIHRRLNERPPHLMDLNPSANIPPHLNDIVRKTLEIDPMNRYQSMDDLKADLELVIG